jgi:hypothetical protein
MKQPVRIQLRESSGDALRLSQGELSWNTGGEIMIRFIDESYEVETTIRPLRRHGSARTENCDLRRSVSATVQLTGSVTAIHASI